MRLIVIVEKIICKTHIYDQSDFGSCVSALEYVVGSPRPQLPHLGFRGKELYPRVARLGVRNTGISFVSGDGCISILK